MDFNTETAWMVRSDGEAFPCVCHIYGSKEDIEETLFAAEWLYQHTANEKTKELCLKMFKTYGVSLSEHRNSVRSILLKIKEKKYRFLDYSFITDISSEIQTATIGNLNKLNSQVNHALNNEFMRVRYGGMYDSEDGNRTLYCRISDDNCLTNCLEASIKWSVIVLEMLIQEKNCKRVDFIEFVSDGESTGECRRLLRISSPHGTE